MKLIIESSIEVPGAIQPPKAGKPTIHTTSKAKSKKHGDNADAIDISAIITEFASATVKVGGKNEELVKLYIRSAFIRAIKGNKTALKKIEEWIVAYFPKPAPSQKTFPSSMEMIQEDVDGLKELGYLPADCPGLIQDIPIALLNKAVKKSKKVVAKKAL